MSNLAKHLLAASAAVLASGSALLLAAGTAHAKDVTVYAESNEEALTRTVSYADLNLVERAGQKTLDRRVGRAVRYVCEPLDTPGIDPLHSACLDYAWTGARPQMARAIERAQQLAATGTSSIAPVAIAVRAASR